MLSSRHRVHFPKTDLPGFILELGEWLEVVLPLSALAVTLASLQTKSIEANEKSKEHSSDQKRKAQKDFLRSVIGGNIWTDFEIEKVL